MGWLIICMASRAMDWVLSLEYDDLEDLQYGTRSRTLWAGLSYYFKNYGNEEPEDQDKTEGTK